jgi:hypothetical protein
MSPVGCDQVGVEILRMLKFRGGAKFQFARRSSLASISETRHFGSI